MDNRLAKLLSLDAPTKQDVAQAKMLAKGKYASRLASMELRRQDANPTPEEKAEAERAGREMLEAMQG